MVGARIGSIGFDGAPDGLNTSTYDFFRAIYKKNANTSLSPLSKGTND